MATINTTETANQATKAKLAGAYIAELEKYNAAKARLAAAFVALDNAIGWDDWSGNDLVRTLAVMVDEDRWVGVLPEGRDRYAEKIAAQDKAAEREAEEREWHDRLAPETSA